MFYLRSGISTLMVLKEILKPLISKETSDKNRMEILFRDDVYSGGGALPQYFKVLGPSIIIRESNLQTFGSEKLKQ